MPLFGRRKQQNAALIGQGWIEGILRTDVHDGLFLATFDILTFTPAKYDFESRRHRHYRWEQVQWAQIKPTSVLTDDARERHGRMLEHDPVEVLTGWVHDVVGGTTLFVIAPGESHSLADWSAFMRRAGVSMR